MPPFRVLVSDSLAPAGLKLLQEAGCEVDVRTDLSPAALAALIPPYDALIIRSSTQVTAALIAAADSLKVIARAGVGIDNVDVAAATQRGIIVVNAPTGNVSAAAEHTLALLLALARHIPAARQTLAQGGWNRNAFMGVELRGKTLGLIGLGRVAGQVAARVLGLNLRVLAYDPYVSADYAGNIGVELVDLDRLLAESDFISVHLPLNEATRGLLDARRLAQCKPGVRLINTARGGIIDEEALLPALDSGHVAGAALDVFTQEPLPPDSPLRTHPRLIVTPHIGGSTAEAQDQVAIDAAEQVVDVLAGRPARYAVNAPLIPSSHMEFITPFIELVETLGRFLTQFAPMQVQALEMHVYGPLAEYDTTILQAAALRGLLAGVVEERVNIVNADLIARRRGIILSEHRQRQHFERYENMVTLCVRGGGEAASVRGSVLGGAPYIVAIEELWVDFLARGHFLVAWHYDKPGVIGAIGALLGRNDINIAFMHVGRRSPRGQAIMVLNTDEPIPPALLPAISEIIGPHRVCIMAL